MADDSGNNDANAQAPQGGSAPPAPKVKQSLLSRWGVPAIVIALAMAALVVWFVRQPDNRDASGSVTKDQKTDITSVYPGDCIASLPSGETVTKVELVPCTQKHTTEVIAVDTLKKPTDDSVASWCNKKATAAIGRAPSSDGYGLAMFQPDSAFDQFVCMAEFKEPLTGQQATGLSSASPSALPSDA